MNGVHIAQAMEPPAPYIPVAPPDAAIIQRIHQVRGQRILLDRDLAELYGVEVRVLKQAVRRNRERLPEDFMIELTLEENKALRSQTVILKQGGHAKYQPFAFTEHGILMLANVIRSDQAIAVSIHNLSRLSGIIRVFTRMRELLLTHHEVLQKLEELEGRLSTHDEEIQAIFDHLTALVSPAQRPGRPIGFKPSDH
ncbi:MAG: ORF6N domain-containing protein [Flavobacteriales bacterium]|nr:ORF6N domain-containing protein [Flavobacteriales bacterium]